MVAFFSNETQSNAMPEISANSIGVTPITTKIADRFITKAESFAPGNNS